MITVVDSEAALEPSTRSSDLVRASVKRLIAHFENLLLVSIFAIAFLTHLPRPSTSDADETAVVDAVVDVLARQIVALFGGPCLVIPLIMITFLTSVRNRLAIVCCCVFIFSHCSSASQLRRRTKKHWAPRLRTRLFWSRLWGPLRQCTSGLDTPDRSYGLALGFWMAVWFARKGFVWFNILIVDLRSGGIVREVQ